MFGELACAIVEKYGLNIMISAIEVASGIVYLEFFTDSRKVRECIKLNHKNAPKDTARTAAPSLILRDAERECRNARCICF
jgi:hypothetical protein